MVLFIRFVIFHVIALKGFHEWNYVNGTYTPHACVLSPLLFSLYTNELKVKDDVFNLYTLVMTWNKLVCCSENKLYFKMFILITGVRLKSGAIKVQS